MAAFSYNQQQHPTFVLDSILVPDTSNNMHILSHDNAQTTATIAEPCFPSMLLPDHHSYQYRQEIPVLPQIHETSTVQLSCTKTSTAGPSFTVEQDSISSAMVGGLAGGEHQLSVEVGFSSMEKKTKSMETKVEIVGKGDEKDSKYCGNPRKAEVRKVKRVSKNQKRIPAEVPSGFVHVRARRGQATDSHSLAERVRRQKISVRMKLLQSLVPGCDKITGKALILDEIIKYVKTLQTQVQYLTANLASVNPIIYGFDLDFNANTFGREVLMLENRCLDFQLPPFVESSSTQSKTSFHEKMAILNSQMFPHDPEQRSHISFQAHYL